MTNVDNHRGLVGSVLLRDKLVIKSSDSKTGLSSN